MVGSPRVESFDVVEFVGELIEHGFVSDLADFFFRTAITQVMTQVVNLSEFLGIVFVLKVVLLDVLESQGAAVLLVVELQLSAGSFAGFGVLLLRLALLRGLEVLRDGRVLLELFEESRARELSADRMRLTDADWFEAERSSFDQQGIEEQLRSLGYLN